MILRRATGTDKSVKERKGLKRKFAAYAGLTLGLILTAGLFAGCTAKTSFSLALPASAAVKNTLIRS